MHRISALRFIVLTTLLILLLPLTPSPGTHAAGDSENLNEVFGRLEERIRRVELKNGLRLILMRQDYAPVVACYMKFKAGSADETEASSGIAHMLEHMLFKGTPSVGTVDFERERKYLEAARSFAARMDHWRRIEREARAEGNEARVKEARAEIAKWQKQLRIVQRQVRPLVIEEEDSYLYSIHGQRGYNAYTTADLTNYQIQLPANRLEVWARLESDRMQNSVLRSFYTERDVVTEERRMRVENVPRRQLFEQFISKVYGDEHPYGRPVIGPMESIQFLNYEQAMQFYERYYSPNNAVITLVGDLDFDEAEGLVRKYFGEMEPRPVRRPREPKLERRRVRVDLKLEGSPTVAMAWFKPALPDPDDLYLDALAEVLSTGQESRLYQRLVAQEQLAVSVGAFTGYPGQRYTNLFFIEVTPVPDADPARIEAVVQEELAKVRENGVTREELERVRNRMRADFIYSLRSNSYLADVLSYYESVTGDYKNLFKYNALLDDIRPEDVRDAVRRHLKPDWTMTATLQPPEQKQ